MKKERTKMPVSQRAKQFAPFAAITGLEIALRKAEEEHRRKIESQVEFVVNPEINEIEKNEEI